jgi:hypothetical protein
MMQIRSPGLAPVRARTSRTSASLRNFSTGDRRPAALRVLDELVELLAAEIGAARRGERLDQPTVGRHLRERVEPRPGEEVNQVDQFHPVAEISLIRPVAVDHLVERHPSERGVDLDALGLGDDPRVQRLDHREDVLLVHERHLDVELGELEPAIGPGRLITQALHDLVVTVLPAHHEQLLQLLGRLRQREEGARTHPCRDEEVARPLGGGAAEQRRLDVHEPELVEMIVHQARDVVPQAQGARHLGATQIEVAVLEAEVLLGFYSVLDQERWRFGSRHDRELGGDDLDVARGERGVPHPLGPFPHGARDAHHPLRAKVLCGRVRLGRFLGMEHDLHGTLTVAQIDEGDTAVIAATGDPAAEGHVGAGVLGAELAAGVGAHRGGEHRSLAHRTPAVATRPATSPIATVSWVPSSSRRSETVPAASSSEPMIAAKRASPRSAILSCAFNGRSS